MLLSELKFVRPSKTERAFNFFTKWRSVDATLKIIKGLSATCAELCDGPRTTFLNGLVQQEKWLDVASYEFEYADSDDLNDLIYSRQIQGLVAKQDYLKIYTMNELKEKAYSDFRASELKCRAVNEMFREASDTGITDYHKVFPSMTASHSDVDVVLYHAQRKIAEVLGEFPSLDSFEFKFGPGASSSVDKAHANPWVKLMARLTCSHDSSSPSYRATFQQYLKTVQDWMIEAWYQTADGDPTILSAHGVLQLVPKSFKALRVILVEPLLNGFFQKGVGSYMKRRLRLFGIDLYDQTRNQKLAKLGSETGEIATIDLKAASDSIAYMLVLSLLPIEWFHHLCTLRTGTYTIPGSKAHAELEKFSSMGNAYTFELESLIFYGIVYGVCKYLEIPDRNVSVYGDDLIVPTGAVKLLTDVLGAVGFSVNPEKSFSEGPFRESCGADYFKGYDVRPFYLKERVSERILYLMHNFFFRNGEMTLAAEVRKHVRQDFAIYGPDGYGDGHLLGEFSLHRNREQRRRGFAGGTFETYQLANRRIDLSKWFGNCWSYPAYSTYVSDWDRLSYLTKSEEAPDHNVVPGSVGVKKVSIYTLHCSIMGGFRPWWYGAEVDESR